MKKINKIIALLLVVIFSFSGLFAVVAFAEDQAVIITTNNDASVKSQTIEQNKTIQLNTNHSDVKWVSSNTEVATVDDNGLVKGKSVGRAVISAIYTEGGISYSDSVEICVTLKRNFLMNFLEKRDILSYKYSYTDNYYYTDKDTAWQHNFGYSALYDLVAPYVLMEYDYVRVHFTYDNKDWMVQLWKGQYGAVFYGSETGVYCKDHTDEEDGIFTFYRCASDDERLYIQTALYHDFLRNGNYTYEFSTPYEKTWWSTGFKPGHLLVEEPANELRQTGRITLNDEKMTTAFVEGFKECGFKQVDKKGDIGIDSFYVDGNDVYYMWQDISTAENTVPIKMAGSALFFANIAALLIGIFLLATFMFGGLMLLIII